MRISVGIDIAKEIHWITALDANGVVQVDRKLPNTPADIAALIAELAALHGTVRIGLDVIGGIAGLAEACWPRPASPSSMCRASPSTAPVRALSAARTSPTHATPGPSPTKFVRDPTCARSSRLPNSTSRSGCWPAVAATSCRRKPNALSRLRDLLVGIFPGLEARLDLKTKGPLHLLTKFVTPAELRTAGKKRLVRHLQAAGGLPKVEELADRVLTVAIEQIIAVPAERMSARLIRELAVEALASGTRLIELDRELEALLQRHPDAALIRSLPGMGAVLTAELIAEASNLARFRSADALASAAGMAPVLRQSGRTRFLRRPNGGNRGLKRVFYQSAFCSLANDDSRAFYERKRREGKRHHQAVIALARRRVNVLWAVLHSRKPFQTGFKTAS